MLTPKPSASARIGVPVSPDQIHALRSRMMAVVSRVCPRWLADQAEDIVQTAMTRVLDLQKKSGEDEGVSSSYLMAAVHNAAVDEVRRRFRRPQVVDGDAAHLELAPASAPHPEEAALAREIDRGIRDCLVRLARPRRMAVTLHLLGYSLHEAVSSSGWSRKRTEHLIYRGLADLRECLTRKGLSP